MAITETIFMKIARNQQY